MNFDNRASSLKGQYASPQNLSPRRLAPGEHSLQTGSILESEFIVCGEGLAINFLPGSGQGQIEKLSEINVRC